MSTTITLIRRDDYVLNCSFTDSNGAAVDLTGATVFFTVKNSVMDPDASALISKTVTSHTNPTGGVTQITLSETDTNISEGSYVYDFQLKNASGTVQSTNRGTIQFTDDVTIRTT